MMRFMFILMLLMAAMMTWWLIPVAFTLWFGWVKILPKLTIHPTQPKKDNISL